MITLHLDTEQAELILITLRASHAIMGARLRRADPEGIISASQELELRKIMQIEGQMAVGAVSEWADLLPIEQQEFMTFCRTLVTTNDQDTQAGAYAHMVSFCTTHRAENPAMAEPLNAAR